jgi:hypothetical protein
VSAPSTLGFGVCFLSVALSFAFLLFSEIGGSYDFSSLCGSQGVWTFAHHCRRGAVRSSWSNGYFRRRLPLPLETPIVADFDFQCLTVGRNPGNQ